LTGKPYVLILLMITLAFFAALSAVLLSWERFSTMSGVNEVGDKTESDYVTIVDSLGRTVKVEKYPKRVVAIGPGTLRLVVYLNATDLLAGVEEIELSRSPLGRDYAMAYGEYLKSLPVIGPGGPRSSPDPVRIRSVSPDLVIMSSLYAQLYDPDRLSTEVEAPVIVIDYGGAGYVEVDDLKKALTILGDVLNRSERARELCDFIDSVIRDLDARTRNITTKPSVYVGAISYKGAQPFTSSQARFPPLVLLNTYSIVDNLTSTVGYVSVDFEYILSAQPNYIFIDINNFNIVKDEFNRDKDKFCALMAFKERRVYSVLPFNYYHTNIATSLADAYFIGKILYPGNFEDVDPVAKANEIFKKFLGKELYLLFEEGYGVGFANLSSELAC